MILLLLKLLIAHTLGDFVFQPNKWVEDKKERKHKSVYLYLHLVVHTATLLVLLQFDLSYWLGIIIIVISHFIIDLIKLNLQKKINARLLFILDQIAHIAIIILVVNSYNNITFDINILYTKKVLATILAILSLTTISAISMKLIMSKWNLEEDESNNSLEKAGMYIGVLERIFVFSFIVFDQWQAIGLLIAAKSVFRFGDLSKAKDRKLTEYILIGTLISFGLAVAIGLLYTQILKN